MGNFIFSVNVTLPVFLVILVGYILKRLNIINDNFVAVANKYVFKVALPVLLFKDIATMKNLSQAKGSFVLFCMFTTIAMFLLIWLFSYLVLKDKSQVGAFSQAAARGSAAILGVAFVENICGSSGMAPLMIMSAVPFFNVLSVIILTFSADMGKKTKDCEEVKASQDVKEKRKKTIKKAFVNIIKNPIIIGILLGMPFAIYKIKIVTIPMRLIDYIGRTATPMALIAIGGGFNKKEALSRVKTAVGASFIKLLALPAIFMPLAFKFDFASSELIAILIMLASPTTVSAYVMAKGMDNDEVLTSNTVMLTTLFSSVTLTFWIYILRSMGKI